MKHDRFFWPLLLGSALAAAACGSQSAPGAASGPAGSAQVSSGQPPQNKCDAAAAQFLVGQTYVPAMLAQALAAAGADQARTLNVDSITTLEFMMGRVNVVTGKDGRVARVHCG